MADVEQKQVVIDVKVDVAEATQRLADATDNVAKLKAEQKALRDEQKNLRDEFAKGNITQAEYTDKLQKNVAALAENQKQLEQNNRTIKSNTAVLQVAGKQTVSETMSLEEQRQTVNALQKAYASLSGEEKKLADVKGGLRDKIKDATDQLKAQEAAIGDNRRNVGNYAESITSAIKSLGDMGDVISKDLDAMKQTNPAMANLASGFKSFDEIGKAFAKNPWLGAFQLLWEILKGNEDAMALLQTALSYLAAAFQKLMPPLQTVGKYLVDGILWAIKGVVAGIKWVLEGIDKLGAKLGKDWHLADSFAEFTESIAESAGALTSVEKAADKAKESVDDLYRYWENWIKTVADAEDKHFKMIAGQAQAMAELHKQMLDEQEADDIAYDAARKAALEKFGLASKNARLEELSELARAKADKLLSDEEYEQAKAEIITKYREQEQAAEEAANAQTLENKRAALDSFGGAALDALGALNNAMGAIENAELAKYKKQQGERKDALKQRLDEGLISQEAYDAEVAAIDEQQERREIELQDKQAKREKAMNIFSATMATASAIIGFMANPSGFAGIALSAMAAITGAAQIAAIAAQPLPSAGKFARGGIVGGTSYTGDKLTANVNSREGIMTLDQQKTLFDIANGNAPAVGGVDYERLAEAMAAQPAPVLAYSEFADFNEKRVTYNEIARI